MASEQLLLLFCLCGKQTEVACADRKLMQGKVRMGICPGVGSSLDQDLCGFQASSSTEGMERARLLFKAS